MHDDAGAQGAEAQGEDAAQALACARHKRSRAGEGAVIHRVRHPAWP